MVSGLLTDVLALAGDLTGSLGEFLVDLVAGLGL